MKQIPLSRNQFALVDDEDFDKLNQFKWSYIPGRKTGYAVRTFGSHDRKSTLSMHRALKETPHGMRIDHADGNGLNNQKSNLRICDHRHNIMNSGPRRDSVSGIKGVMFRHGKWTARITIEGRKDYLGGGFLTKQGAALAYHIASLLYFGEYAYAARNLGNSAS